jgi:phosphopantothenoylcysteine decarboxylase/phosphopantothenate--cysteine ligase
VVDVAYAKRASKGCDWIVANDVSGDVMGGDRNRVHLITAAGVESWDEGEKSEVARRLAGRIAAALGEEDADGPAAPDAAGEAG